MAIATALMPPLCTAGYGLATWQLNYFFGAFYLFLINSIFISLSTFIGVKLMKYRHVPVTDPVRARRVRRIVLAAAILILLPSIYLTYNMQRESRFEINAGRFVSEECRFPATHVLADNTTWHHGHGTLDITLIGAPLPPDSLHQALSSRLADYGLEGITLNIMQDSSPVLTPQDLEGNSVRDVYELTQAALTQKQVTIDSLRAVLHYAAGRDSVSATLAPELRVIFPQVGDMALSRAIFASTASGSESLDTVDVALVRLDRPLPAASRTELARYLEARLRLRSVRVVDMPSEAGRR